MKILALALLAVALLGCHSVNHRQTAPSTTQTDAIIVEGIPAIHEKVQAQHSPQAQPAPPVQAQPLRKRRPGVAALQDDNSEGFKQAKTLLSMTSQERLECADQMLKGTGIDYVRDSQ